MQPASYKSMTSTSHIASNIEKIRNTLPQNCKLVVVSKYRELWEIEGAYATGQRMFAENRVQALMERAEALPTDIQWHLIGHLQTNKVKYIAPFIAMIHAVDSFKLLQEIDKEAAKHNRLIPCLIQLHVAEEETKFGLTPEETHAFFDAFNEAKLKHVRIVGLMAMASNTDNQAQISAEFAVVKNCFEDIKAHYFQHDDQFRELSIGMSSDYPIAIEHGSTLIRVGSAVFAE